MDSSRNGRWTIHSSTAIRKYVLLFAILTSHTFSFSNILLTLNFEITNYLDSIIHTHLLVQLKVNIAVFLNNDMLNNDAFLNIETLNIATFSTLKL